jgi:hypothetical protein
MPNPDLKLIRGKVSARKVDAQTSAPKHLRPETRAWFDAVMDGFALEPHHVKLLILAAEALDRCEQARIALAEHGTVYVDRYNCPHPRPEVAIERDSRLAYARVLRELDLDAAVTPTSRPPSLPSIRRS